MELVKELVGRIVGQSNFTADENNNTVEQGMNLARNVVFLSGLPNSVGGVTDFSPNQIR